MTRKCLWLTDLHVDKLSRADQQQLLQAIVSEQGCDAVWITGDIGEPPANLLFLESLLTKTRLPIYFLLGNHDYYQHSIQHLRTSAQQLMDKFAHAHYLTALPALVYEDNLLAGVDGWANTGDVPLREKTWDGDAIIDWQGLSITALQAAMNKRAIADAELLINKCRQALNTRIKRVYLLTHVPLSQAVTGIYPAKPLQLRRSVYYSHALGHALEKLAACYRQIEFYLYSGHVHQGQLYQIGDNMQGQIAAAYRPNQPFTWVLLP